MREQLRSKTSERRQAYAGCGAVESASGKVTRLNSTDSAFSLSTEDRIGVRVAEMETEIRSLKVYHFLHMLNFDFSLLCNRYNS